MKIVLILLIAEMTFGRGGLFQPRPADRSLFLTLDRNQQFYRNEDRMRCELTSPGGSHSDHP